MSAPLSIVPLHEVAQCAAARKPCDAECVRECIAEGMIVPAAPLYMDSEPRVFNECITRVNDHVVCLNLYLATQAFLQGVVDALRQ